MNGKRFADVYADYMAGHQHPWNRRLHAVFFVLGITYLVLSIVHRNPWYLLLVLPTWVLPFAGHRLVEKNREATPEMMRERGWFDVKYLVVVHAVDTYCLLMMTLETLGLRRARAFEEVRSGG